MVKIFKRLAILFVVLSFILPGYDVYCTLAKDDDYREYLIKNGINGNLDGTPTDYAPKILTNPLIKDYIDHFNNSAFDGNKLVKMPHVGTEIKNSGYWYKPAENIVVREGNRKQFLFIARVNKDATTRDSVINYEAWSPNHAGLKKDDFYVYILAYKDSKSDNFKFYFTETTIGGGHVEQGHPGSSYAQSTIGTQTATSVLKFFNGDKTNTKVDSTSRAKLIDNLKFSRFDVQSNTEPPSFNEVFSDVKGTSTKTTKVRRIAPLSNNDLLVKTNALDGKPSNYVFSQDDINNGVILNTNTDAINFLKKAIDVTFFDFDRVDWKKQKIGSMYSKDYKFKNFYETQVLEAPFNSKDEDTKLVDGSLIRLRTRKGSTDDSGWYKPGKDDTRYLYYQVTINNGKVSFSPVKGSDWGSDKDSKLLSDFITVSENRNITKSSKIKSNVASVHLYTPLKWKYNLDNTSVDTMKANKVTIDSSNTAWPKETSDSTKYESMLIEIVYKGGAKEYYKLNTDLIGSDGKIHDEFYHSLLDLDIISHEEFRDRFIPNPDTQGKLSTYFKTGKGGNSLVPLKGVTVFKMQFKKYSDGKPYALVVAKGGKLSKITKSSNDEYYLAYLTSAKKGKKGETKNVYIKHTIFKIQANSELNIGILNKEVASNYKSIQQFLAGETNGIYITLDDYKSALKSSGSEVELLKNLSVKMAGDGKTRVYSMDPAWLSYLLKEDVVNGDGKNSNNFYLPVESIECITLEDKVVKGNQKLVKSKQEFPATMGNTKFDDDLDATVLTSYSLANPSHTLSFSASSNNWSKVRDMAIKVNIKRNPKIVGHRVTVDGNKDDGSDDKKKDKDNENDSLLYIVRDFNTDSPRLERVTMLPSQFDDDDVDASGATGSISKTLKLNLTDFTASYDETMKATHCTFKFKIKSESSRRALILPYYTSLNTVSSFQFSTIGGNTKVLSSDQVAAIDKFFILGSGGKNYVWNRLDLGSSGINSNLYAFSTEGIKDGSYTLRAVVNGIKLPALSKKKLTTNKIKLYGIKFIVIDNGVVKLLDPS
jgi:hypothetical protein